MTTHRLVARPQTTALGTSGHGHRRAMTVDAAGRRLTWHNPRGLPDDYFDPRIQGAG
jgi:hypothetical protein